MQAAREFIREAIDAERERRPFTETRVFDVAAFHLVRPPVVRGPDRGILGTGGGVGAFQAQEGSRRPDGRITGPVTISISLPYVRVKFNEESYGMGIEDAGALAGVIPIRPAVPAPPPPPPVPVLVPFEMVPQPMIELRVVGQDGREF